MAFICPNNVLFECNRCGLCCGDTEEKTRCILLLESEAAEISVQTGLPKEAFTKPTPKKEPYQFEVKKFSNGKCYFLKDNQCGIYELRPLICRFYPFKLTFDCNQNQHVFGFTCECPQIGRGKVVSKRDFDALFLLAQQRLP